MARAAHFASATLVTGFCGSPPSGRIDSRIGTNRRRPPLDTRALRTAGMATARPSLPRRSREGPTKKKIVSGTKRAKSAAKTDRAPKLVVLASNAIRQAVTKNWGCIGFTATANVAEPVNG